MRDLRNSSGFPITATPICAALFITENPRLKTECIIDAQMQYYTRYLEEGVY